MECASGLDRDRLLDQQVRFLIDVDCLLLECFWSHDPLTGTLFSTCGGSLLSAIVLYAKHSKLC
jgi:hypothetical protein